MSAVRPVVPTVARHRARPATVTSHVVGPDQNGCVRASDLRVTSRPIDELRPNRRNARKHPKKQVTKIAASIKRFGFNNPIVIDGAGIVLAGHGRLEAAKQLGLAAVPTICLAHLTAQEQRAYMLADNRLAEIAQWDDAGLKLELKELCEADLDFSIELTGFDTAEIDVLLDEDPTSDASNAADEALPALGKVAITRAGDLWQLGRHVLTCGDAREPSVYVRLLAGNKVQLVIIDPPYNCRVEGHVSGLGKHHHREFAMASGEMSPTEFTAFLQSIFTQLVANSVDGSLHYCCMDHHHIDEMVTAAGRVYTERKNLLVWAKTNAGMGSFYRSQHELIFLCKNGTASHVNNVQLGVTGRYRTNVLEYAGANTFSANRDQDLNRHPTCKPVPLIADLIRDASNIHDWVLDCCVGGGTIFLAAEKTRRRAAGVEIDPLYCDVAIERWQAFTGESAVLVDTGQTFAEVARDRLTARPSAQGGSAGEPT